MISNFKYAHPNHPMGDSKILKLDQYVNGVDELIYILIPKNASTWIKRHFLPSKDYNYYAQGFAPSHQMVFTSLRDPLDRWISGFAQYVVGNRPEHRFHIDNLDWDQVMEQMVFDNHTQPQVDFIANLPRDQVTFFRCDNELSGHVVNFMSTFGIETKIILENNNNWFNITQEQPSKWIEGNCYMAPPQQTIVDKILTKLKQNSKYIDRIQQFYQQDYQLYNTVKYYGTR